MRREWPSNCRAVAMARMERTTLIKWGSERPLTIGWRAEAKVPFLRGAVCRRCNYKLDLNKQTAAAWPPPPPFMAVCWLMLKMSACFDAHFQAQSQRAHKSLLYIERAANAAPCYHARPHMHCILSNDKSSKRINIHRAYMQTYNV